MKALECGHTECVKVLLDRGADVNMQDMVSTVEDYFNICWRHVYPFGVWCVGLLWGHSRLILTP